MNRKGAKEAKEKHNFRVPKNARNRILAPGDRPCEKARGHNVKKPNTHNRKGGEDGVWNRKGAKEAKEKHNFRAPKNARNRILAPGDRPCEKARGHNVKKPNTHNRKGGEDGDWNRKGAKEAKEKHLLSTQKRTKPDPSPG